MSRNPKPQIMIRSLLVRVDHNMRQRRLWYYRLVSDTGSGPTNTETAKTRGRSK